MNCYVCNKRYEDIHLNQETGECDFCLDKRSTQSFRFIRGMLYEIPTPTEFNDYFKISMWDLLGVSKDDILDLNIEGINNSDQTLLCRRKKKKST